MEENDAINQARLRQVMGRVVQYYTGPLYRHVLFNNVLASFRATRNEVEAAYRELVKSGLLIESTPGFWSQLRAALAHQEVPVRVRHR